MTHPNREIPRPTCHGEELPAALTGAPAKECHYCGHSGMPLRIESGGGPYHVPDTLICEDCHVLQIHPLGWDDLPLADTTNQPNGETG